MELPSFYVIGIETRTTNENNQCFVDIKNTWQKFFSENILEKIPNKVDGTIYSVYTDYEGDHTQPYTYILGAKVNAIDSIPEGMRAIEVPASQYKKFTAKGNLNENVVYEEWKKIWNTPLKRTYTTDFEILDERAKNPENAEVDIFISVED